MTEHSRPMCCNDDEIGDRFGKLFKYFETLFFCAPGTVRRTNCVTAVPPPPPATCHRGTCTRLHGNNHVVNNITLHHITSHYITLHHITSHEITPWMVLIGCQVHFPRRQIRFCLAHVSLARLPELCDVFMYACMCMCVMCPWYVMTYGLPWRRRHSRAQSQDA